MLVSFIRRIYVLVNKSLLSFQKKKIQHFLFIHQIRTDLRLTNSASLNPQW